METEILEIITQHKYDHISSEQAVSELLDLFDVVGQRQQLVCSRCNENEKQEANDPYCIDCKIEIEAN